jgi:hypothetical protein
MSDSFHLPYILPRKTALKTENFREFEITKDKPFNNKFLNTSRSKPVLSKKKLHNELPRNKIFPNSSRIQEKYPIEISEKISTSKDQISRVLSNRIYNNFQVKPDKYQEIALKNYEDEDKINQEESKEAASFNENCPKVFRNDFISGLSNMVKPVLINISFKNSGRKQLKLELIGNENNKTLFRSSKLRSTFEILDKGLIFEYLPTRWIGGKIPCFISRELKNNKKTLKTLQECFEVFNKLKVVEFFCIENKYLNDRDFVMFDIDLNISSQVLVPVGRYPGENQVILPKDLSKPAVLHILMHILGFTHQLMSNDKKNFYCYLYPSNFPRESQEDSKSSDPILLNSNFYGPYDPCSVLHLPACSQIKECSNKEIIQNIKKLSDLDIKKIKFFYGPQKCTGDFFKKPFIQSHYYCKTCWHDCGVPICVYCAEIHHQGHELEYVNFGIAGNKEVKCGCGVLKHVTKCAKFLKGNFKIRGFNCDTCKEFSDGNNVIVCFLCKETCHSNHNVKDAGEIDAKSCGCDTLPEKQKKNLKILTISGCFLTS